MRSFLLQPYPFSNDVRNKLIVCSSIGLFIFLFLRVFEPFGFGELSPADKWLHALAFGAVTFFISAFIQIVFPWLFPGLFREEKWRSWKEIVYLLFTTVLVGAGNYGLMLALYPQTTSFSGFLRAQLVTLQVGIFPIAAIVFMKQMMLFRRYVAEARQVSAGIQTAGDAATAILPREVAIVLRGENQNEELTLLPHQLLLVQSADNYVKVLREQGLQTTPVMLRSSLKKIEEQLKNHPQFFRCHRMYLVNLQRVKKVGGNAQGLKLYLTGFDEAVPVSRSLTGTVQERLHAASHLPQNT